MLTAAPGISQDKGHHTLRGRLACPPPAAHGVPPLIQTLSRARPLLLWLLAPCDTRCDVAMDVRIIPFLLNMGAEGLVSSGFQPSRLWQI